MSESALPYQEPDIVVILILISFFLLLNIIGYVLDSLLYCGLLGQLFIGVAWGTPGGQWLSAATQEAFVDLGYLGLILLVYEGGLSTNFEALMANLWLSVFVALTGIVAPIGISFVLMRLVGATALQAFAAGAALCSTSLGTTFTVLKTSGLTQSRLGVVLTSAAMLDDVVGLVMVQIISNLGIAGSSFKAAAVIRPVGVSVAFAVVIMLVSRFVLKPLSRRLRGLSAGSYRMLSNSQLAFLTHTTVLVGLVTGSSYAGTSNLFAAYLGGASISWYDSITFGTSPESPMSNISIAAGDAAEAKSQEVNDSQDENNFLTSDNVKVIPERGSPAEPHTATVTPTSISVNDHSKRIKEETSARDKSKDGHGAENDANQRNVINTQTETEAGPQCTGISTWEKYYQTPVSTILTPLFFASVGFSIPISQMFTKSIIWRSFVYAILMALAKLFCGFWLIRFSTSTKPAPASSPPAKDRRLPKPKSLYPASILGCAMVARGEIGFLVSAIAESRGVFSSASHGEPSELFLIVTWAIMLCTIAGPIAVGLLTKRVRRLQMLESDSAERREDPLEILGFT